MKLDIMNKNIYKYLIIAGVTFYLLLCGLHFVSGRPLWLDEEKVLKNIQELTPGEIFGSLKYNQGFPRVYLFLIRSISSQCDYNIYSLRVLPFILMISAFFLWLYILKKEEGRGVFFLLFILSWCGSHFMTYYAAELKQYSADVLTSGLFVLLLLNQRDHLSKENISFEALAGYALIPISIFFSYTGYFYILIPVYNLILSLRKRKSNLLYLAVYLIAAGICIYFSFNYDIKFTRADTPLRVYWNDYFISTAGISEFFQTLTEGIRNLFVRWFLETKILRHIITFFLPTALFAAVFFGIKKLKQDKYQMLSLKTLVPCMILALFTAGILKIYPFTGARITIFIAPLIIYTLIKGIFILKPKFPRIHLIFLTVYTLTLTCTSIYLLINYLKLL